MYTYSYEYQNYPDCPEATSLSRFFCSPKHGAYIGAALGVILMGLGALAYNANNHEPGIIDTILMLLGFIFFLGEAFLVPRLFMRFKISDRGYEKKTGKKIS